MASGCLIATLDQADGLDSVQAAGLRAAYNDPRREGRSSDRTARLNINNK